ncbi:MAG: FxsA family protein [Candidatus Scalinduaceae bacterium]
MLVRLILLFTFIPLIELYLLIQVGKYLGAFTTVAIVFVTGIAGGILARGQGLNVYRHIKMDMQNGVIPTNGLLDGLFILVAGALLVTPGLITDVVGFLIMIPGFRRWLKKLLKKRIMHKFESSQFHFHSSYHSADWQKDDDF